MVSQIDTSKLIRMLPMDILVVYKSNSSRKLVSMVMMSMNKTLINLLMGKITMKMKRTITNFDDLYTKLRIHTYMT
jgi:hypothetical protein